MARDRDRLGRAEQPLDDQRQHRQNSPVSKSNDEYGEEERRESATPQRRDGMRRTIHPVAPGGRTPAIGLAAAAPT